MHTVVSLSEHSDLVRYVPLVGTTGEVKGSCRLHITASDQSSETPNLATVDVYMQVS